MAQFGRRVCRKRRRRRHRGQGSQTFDTLQFSTTGYVLSAGAGGQLQLAGPSGTGTINTDTGITTTINTPIVDGSAQNLGKVGGGTLIFGGSSTYTGTTTVTAGTLDVEGSIASSLMTTVNVGSKLTGNGTVGNTTINGGGIFAPGSGMPGSSMTVAGNLALQSGAQYVVMLNPSSSSFATVTGTAALSGATVNAMFAAGSYVGKQYTIVNTTGGLGGSTFSALVNSNLPSGFKTSLSYDANSAYLDLALLFIPPPNSGLSGNQSGVGNALINYFNKNGGIPLVFGGLTTAGLTQVSGETATGGLQTTFNAMTQFMGMMTDPFTAGRGVDEPGAPAFADDALAYAAKRKPVDAFAMFTKAPPVAPTFEARWSVWASGFGGSQTTNGNTSSGSNTVSQQHRRHRRRRGLRCCRRPPWPASALAGGRHQVLRGQWRQRPFGPVPGRRVRQAHGWRPPISPPLRPMAGRTSPPTAPSPSQASIACMRSSMPTASPVASKAATAT